MRSDSLEFLEILHCALQRQEAITYVLDRLDYSLSEIDIDEKCIESIKSSLLKIANIKRPLRTQEFIEIFNDFDKKWRAHLDIVYEQGFEAIRWEYFKKFVFGEPPGGNKYGRCLDWGCGKGHMLSELVQEGYTESAIGIDPVDFKEYWRKETPVTERVSYLKVDFEDINEELDQLRLAQSGEFNSIFLFYVLHHSPDYWVSKTLMSIKENMSNGSRLYVLEDSISIEFANQVFEDPFNLTKKWTNWIDVSKPYNLSVGYDVQVILDFVAVQFLAGFKEVLMPCNYKLGSEWRHLFISLGFKIREQKFIGFPSGRDIDVPQLLFVLENTN